MALKTEQFLSNTLGFEVHTVLISNVTKQVFHLLIFL